MKKSFEKKKQTENMQLYKKREIYTEKNLLE